MQAVMGMKGQGDMNVADAVAMIHNTPPSRGRSSPRKSGRDAGSTGRTNRAQCRSDCTPTGVEQVNRMEQNKPDSCADELMRSARLCFMLSFAQTVCTSALVGDRGLFVAIVCSGVAAAIILRRTCKRRPGRKDHAADPPSPATKILRSARRRH
jgi:hypothetical protein